MTTETIADMPITKGRTNRFLLHIPGIPSWLLHSVRTDGDFLVVKQWVQHTENIVDLLNMKYPGGNVKLQILDDHGIIIEELVFVGIVRHFVDLDELNWRNDDIVSVIHRFKFLNISTPKKPE